MPTRRTTLRGLGATGGLLLLGLPRRGVASAPTLRVAVPHAAVGALVHAIGGDSVKLVLEDALDPTVIEIGAKPVEIGQRVLLKGDGDARERYLDDARNAPKVGAHIRDALAKSDPGNAPSYESRHRAWSRPFARQVLAWREKLQRSNVRGKRLRDAHGRIYLLEWAGATVVASAAEEGPAALARLPKAPKGMTLAAYQAYVQSLVDAVT